MTTLKERQVELEHESLSLGVARYEEHRKEQGDSATSPGRVAARETVPVLVAAIEQFIGVAEDRKSDPRLSDKTAVGGTRARAAGAGRRHSVIPYLVNLEPEAAASLTFRYALDGACSVRPVQTVALELANAVQDHVNLLAMKRDDSDDDEVRRHQRNLFRKIEEQVKKATTERHRTGVWRHVIDKYRPDALKWSDREKLLLGMKLIELLTDSTDLVRSQRQTRARHDTPIYLMLTDKGTEWFEKAHNKASFWYPVHQPMLVEPRDWKRVTTEGGRAYLRGGYLTGALRAPMVLTHSPNYLEELLSGDIPDIYDAINTVQRTPWKINTAVLAVALEAHEAGVKFRSLLAEQPLPMPVRPGHISKEIAFKELPLAQREVILEWKMRMGMAHEENHRRTSNEQAMQKQLGVAKKFAGEEAIWFPHYFDFRGRLYPYASYLNPQHDDLARGLLQFAEGKALGQRGAHALKVHIANLFGIDKVSFEDRVAWVEENAERLLDSATRPLDGEMFWTTAENKWQALAACFEYAGWCVQGSEYVSYLPIAVDGSCSGLQHYSALLRDPIGGAAVNLVPAEKPGDIYTEVATRAQAMIDASHEGDAAPWKGGKVVRKIAKQPTMTYCYSATRFGMGKQIMRAVDGLGGVDYLNGENVNVKQASVYMAGVVRAAIGEAVVAAKTAMEFLKEVAALAAQNGLPIKWVAPSGFPVVQAYKEIIGDRVEIMFQGVRTQLIIWKDGEKIDAKRQASGVAPNFVHSLDASHLIATVNSGRASGLFSWACVHDSFGVHACDVDTLDAVLRETFIEQYTPDVLAEFREQIVRDMEATAPELIEKLPPLPPQGSLDLALVRDATYFFA